MGRAILYPTERMIMATSKMKLREVSDRFYKRSYFALWFFAVLTFFGLPNKHVIKSESAGAAHLDHFVDAVPVFVLFLLAFMLCVGRALWLAPRLRKAVAKGHATYRPLALVPFGAAACAFMTVVVCVFAFDQPVAFAIVVVLLAIGIGLLLWKGHKG